MEDLAGRSYARVYRVKDKQDIHDFLVQAVERSGGQVLYASPASRAPVYLGVQTAAGERLGLLIYHFRMEQRTIRNRPTDEVRGQMRYGGKRLWDAGGHVVGQDVAGVDITLMLGVHIERDIVLGLQPSTYDPMPLGISFYAKEERLALAKEQSWAVWEHETKPGKRRKEARSAGLETMVAFTPERILDYALFERRATDLRLDQPLRYSVAKDVATQRLANVGSASGLHELEEDFGLSSREIIEIIAERGRLKVAVRGGVAERHLERILREDPTVRDVERLDEDGLHDFNVTMQDGQILRVECKNASPERYANGDFKVEVQKTRASKNDPASRFYRVDQFDVVAACLYSPTREWKFHYQLTDRLARHSAHPDRLAPMQPVTAAWAPTLATAVT